MGRCRRPALQPGRPHPPLMHNLAGQIVPTSVARPRCGRTQAGSGAEKPGATNKRPCFTTQRRTNSWWQCRPPLQLPIDLLLGLRTPVLSTLASGHATRQLGCQPRCGQTSRYSARSTSTLKASSLPSVSPVTMVRPQSSKASPEVTGTSDGISAIFSPVVIS